MATSRGASVSTDKPDSTSRIPSAAASNNPTLAKTGPGRAFRAIGQNAKASVVYLKLYDVAVAPVVGTDVPVITIPLAASSVFNMDIGGSAGFPFANGIGYGFATGAADNSAVALAAGDILGFTLTFS